MTESTTKPIRLSPEQQEIVDYRGGHLQVIACAGSGKTESISRRVASLIGEGVEPESIIAFTFTEKAAAELKDRIYKRVEEVKGKDFLGRLGPMFVGTIHAYCFHLLQDYVPKYGNYDVLDEHRHTALISRRRKGLKLDKLHVQHWKSINLFLRAADVIGNEMIPLENIEGTDVGDCYVLYLDMLERFRFLTFGMIIAKTVEVLQNEPAIYERVQGAITHLIVDEYQDINPAQEKLIQLLAADPVKLCVVGDDDQAIYQWRGSDVGNIVDFKERYPDANAIKLEANRRSRPEIVKTANAFAQTIPNRLEKEMQPNRPAGPVEVFPWAAETSADEAEIIADHILALHESGWRYQDMSILFRSVRTAAPPFVEAFNERGIPFNCGGRTGLFVHPEINNFGELFAWMSDFSWRDERFGESRDAHIDNVTHGLARSFDLTEAERKDLEGYFKDWKQWHSRGNRRVSLVGDFYKHLKILGVDQIDPESPQGSARLGAFARFSTILADYEHVTLRSRWTTNEDGERVFRSGRDRGKWFWMGLANYLVHYARESYEDFEGEEIHNLDAVSVLTVHQSKGLEWPILFIPSLTNRRFPSSQTGRTQDWSLSHEVFPNHKRSRYEGSDADERRLFYVAMTRARDVVYASAFQRMTKRVGTSVYLNELADSVGIGELPVVEQQLPQPDPPEQLKDIERPPLELGYSDLADYEDCGFMYRLSRIFGFQRELAAELGYGNAVHHVLRHVAEHAKETGQAPSAEELDDLIAKELYVPFANESTYSNMTRSVKALVASYIHDWPGDLKRIWATERPFEIHLGEGILSGRADVILDEEDGVVDQLAIVDYKTATDKARDERYANQLTIYAAAGQQEGLSVDGCYLHELKNSNRTEVDASVERMQAVTDWATQQVQDIASGSYPVKAEETKCSNCDFKLVCKHSCSIEG
jgi:DNA helicase-2/ATP-dependent DNA helicase PcrA